MKNITLSADEKLLTEVRAYARAHDMTLNQLIRDYMRCLIGGKSGADAAGEFASLSRDRAGESADGFRFDRQSAHMRGGHG